MYFFVCFHKDYSLVSILVKINIKKLYFYFKLTNVIVDIFRISYFDSTKNKQSRNYI